MAAVAACRASSPRHAAFYDGATPSARVYIAFRFYAAVYPEGLSPAAYDAYRDHFGAALSEDDIKYLLAYEKEIDEIKFLVALRRTRGLSPSPSEGLSPNPVRGLSPEQFEDVRSSSASSVSRGAGNARKVFWGVLVGVIIAIFASILIGMSLSRQDDRGLSPLDQGLSPSVTPLEDDREEGLSPSLPRGLSPSAPPETMPSVPQDIVRISSPTNAIEPSRPSIPSTPSKRLEPSPRGLSPTNSFPTLVGLGGIRFGEAVVGRVVAREAIVSDTGVVCDVVVGPEVKKSFPGFGIRPRLAVTPKTRSVWRMSFPGTDPVNATNRTETFSAMAARLAARFGQQPESVSNTDVHFPRGETDVRLCLDEKGLILEVTHRRFQKKAQDEFALIREEARNDLDTGRLMAADYPNGGRAKYNGLEFASGTPKSFCGIVFGSLPAATARMDRKIKGFSGFFVDYAGWQARPFKGFSFGRVDLDRRRGGVCAVHLYSRGPADTLTPAEYYDNVSRTLSAAYKTTPAAEDGGGAFATRVFTVGDITVTLEVDPRGGFALHAVHRVYASLLPR